MNFKKYIRFTLSTGARLKMKMGEFLMTKTNWFRLALMGSAALGVLATAARADELTDLKAQLEALQSRVNTLEAAPAPQAPAGGSNLVFKRGQGTMGDWGNEARRESAGFTPADRGFTVAITPSADLPAPVAEVTVYGYVKGDVMYTNRDVPSGTAERSFNPHLLAGRPKNGEFDIQANQTRFGIRAKVDTAIGQIRARIEGDFEGSPYGTTTNFRQRHTYGEWDITDNWTILIGQSWHIASLLPIGVSTVDFNGGVVTYSRSPLVRLTYHSGPLTWAVGIGDPQSDHGDYPNFGTYIQYDAAGGHQLVFAAEVSDIDPLDAPKSGTSWVIAAGANINLGDIATLTTGANIGRGVTARRYIVEGFSSFDAAGNPTEVWSAMAGVQFSVSETTTVNFQIGYADQHESFTSSACAAAVQSAICVTDVTSLHANILWRPVKQMRLGWEIAWGHNDYYAAASQSVIRGQFGAWFFF